jgi:uncharacterized Tic20 family protein
METTNNNKSIAAMIHLSTLSQYIIPFGNFIFPIVIWSSSKEKSDYIDVQGKRTINFQLSLFLYTLVLSIIVVPILLITVLKNIDLKMLANDNGVLIENFDFQNYAGIIIFGLIAVFIFALLKVFEFFLIIYAAVKTSNGTDYKYPLTIKFIK